MRFIYPPPLTKCFYYFHEECELYRERVQAHAATASSHSNRGRLGLSAHALADLCGVFLHFNRCRLKHARHVFLFVSKCKSIGRFRRQPRQCNMARALLPSVDSPRTSAGSVIGNDEKSTSGSSMVPILSLLFFSSATSTAHAASTARLFAARCVFGVVSLASVRAFPLSYAVGIDPLSSISNACARVAHDGASLESAAATRSLADILARARTSSPFVDVAPIRSRAHARALHARHDGCDDASGRRDASHVDVTSMCRSMCRSM